MKARIPNQKEQALLCFRKGEEEHARAARKTVETLGIEVREISGGMLAATLEECLTASGNSDAQDRADAAEPPEGGAMVMAGMANARVDALLNALRNAGTRVRYKAVLTPHNRSWTFEKLFQELAREEAIMGIFLPMRERLSRAKRLPPSAELKEAIRQAQAVTDGKTEPTVEALERAGEALRLAMGE